MTAEENKSKPLGLSIVIGIAIGTLAALLSGHVAVWMIAGIFVGIAAGASVGRKECPECEAREHESKLRATSGELRGTSKKIPTLSLQESGWTRVGHPRRTRTES